MTGLPSRLECGDWLVVPDEPVSQQHFQLDPEDVTEMTQLDFDDSIRCARLPAFHGWTVPVQHLEETALFRRRPSIKSNAISCRSRRSSRSRLIAASPTNYRRFVRCAAIPYPHRGHYRYNSEDRTFSRIPDGERGHAVATEVDDRQHESTPTATTRSAAHSSALAPRVRTGHPHEPQEEEKREGCQTLPDAQARGHVAGRLAD